MEPIYIEVPLCGTILPYMIVDPSEVEGSTSIGWYGALLVPSLPTFEFKLNVLECCKCFERVASAVSLERRVCGNR